MATIGSGDRPSAAWEDPRARYEARIAAMRADFAASGDGEAACRARSAALDTLIQSLWGDPGEATGVTILAVGGYGRQQVFPFSDVDLLFCSPRGPSGATTAKIRDLTQSLWDCGLRVSPATRTLADIERLQPADPEFGLSLLDLRLVAGSAPTADAVRKKVLERRSAREARTLASTAASLTRERHLRFGNTLFHLEPNLKDAPGGLRDANIYGWLSALRPKRNDPAPTATGHFGNEEETFHEAVAFLTSCRVFLHLRHGRDDNTLDWHAQDEAAAQGIGMGWAQDSRRRAPNAGSGPPSDAASWMRAYFRQARAIERALTRELERSDLQRPRSRVLRRLKAPPLSGFFLRDGILELKKPAPAAEGGQSLDPAHEAEIVLAAFGLMAASGISLALSSEKRIAASIPYLSATLEEGPRLWSRLRAVLLGPHAGDALRELHALGLLELILPEFHGIDALVIRDAYHRYTVDEHTFVLIDALHSLAAELPPAAPEWRLRFRSFLLELPHPDLLYLAALLHDTGKGRAAIKHADASRQLAASVCGRLELSDFETALVVRLVQNHLEMSAALRRDIFDTETIRTFAEKIQTHELLRMLTLFTWADISAVHPDALTPWKAENLWRLFMATANHLDRSVDEDRLHTREAHTGAAIQTLLQALGPRKADHATLESFLEGFPERYLRTTPPEKVQQHSRMLEDTAPGGAAAPPVLLHYKDGLGEVSIVYRERPNLFADLTAILDHWGMDVLTAEAFSNAHGAVVDTFRFTDTFRTLAMNPEEHDRFLADLGRAVQVGLSSELKTQPVPARRGRRSPLRRIVSTSISFDNHASAHSTLLQIVAQNRPGLLRTAAQVLSAGGCSIEVALIDTEGDMAIDVFYLTESGKKLESAGLHELSQRLGKAIEANAR